MYVRDSEYNLLGEIEKSKESQRTGTKVIERGELYHVTVDCLRDMMQYCAWMPVHFFPIGFLFSVLSHADAPSGIRFKVDGWVVTVKKELKFVTLIIGGEECYY